MKKVLIIGINGLIGRAVLEYLAQSGAYDLVGTVRHLDARRSPPEDVIFTKLDITDKYDFSIIRKNFGSFDAIVNCAAAISGNSEDLILTNCMGLLNCIKLGISLGCTRFIQFSSIRVVGMPRSFSITENHPVSPQSLYHISKLFGEQVLLLPENLCLNPAIFRLSSPVGPGLKGQRIIPTFLRCALHNEDIILYGHGSRKQNYIDTRDIAKAVDCALKSDRTGIYNVAALRTTSNMDVAFFCKDICRSSSKIVFNGKEDPEESFDWMISIEKISRDMNFVPDFSLEDSLEYTLSAKDSTFL